MLWNGFQRTGSGMRREKKRSGTEATLRRLRGTQQLTRHAIASGAHPERLASSLHSSRVATALRQRLLKMPPLEPKDGGQGSTGIRWPPPLPRTPAEAIPKRAGQAVVSIQHGCIDVQLICRCIAQHERRHVLRRESRDGRDSGSAWMFNGTLPRPKRILSGTCGSFSSADRRR